MHALRYVGSGRTIDDASPSGYAAALRWLDGHLQRLLAIVEDRGLLERTVVVFTSDHGEMLGEHGRSYHGLTLFEEEVRVPLVFRAPGIAPGLIEGPASLLDVTPTVLELLGAPHDPAHEGRSLVPALHGQAMDPDRLLYLENVMGYSAAVIAADHKLIFNKLTGVLQRYDLARDPGEQTTAYDADADIDRSLLRSLITRRPDMAAAEANDPETLPLLASALRSPAASRDGERLRFMLAVARACGSEACAAEVRALAQRAHDPGAKAAARECLARWHDTPTGPPAPS
jgi:arylsulfatase A-like enzyme